MNEKIYIPEALTPDTPTRQQYLDIVEGLAYPVVSPNAKDAVPGTYRESMYEVAGVSPMFFGVPRLGFRSYVSSDGQNYANFNFCRYATASFYATPAEDHLSKILSVELASYDNGEETVMLWIGEDRRYDLSDERLLMLNTEIKRLKVAGVLQRLLPKTDLPNPS